MFKVGDWVCMNPKHFTNGVDTVKGVITSELIEQEPDVYVLDWEDGSKGWVSLDTKYLLLV